MTVREYYRVEPDRVAELEARGWQVAAATPFLGGHGIEVLMVRSHDWALEREDKTLAAARAIHRDWTPEED